MPDPPPAAPSDTTLVSATNTATRERAVIFAAPPSTRSERADHPPRLPRALSLVPVKLTNLPRKEILIAEAEMLLFDSQSWKPGKTYNGIKTYSHQLETTNSSDTWCCVASEHPATIEMSYAKFWTKMSKDRIRSQQKYTPEITSVNDIKFLSKSQSIWSVSYDFGSPLSPRVFTMLQIIKLIDTVPGARTGISITIPVDLNTSSENLAVLEDLGVKGRFVTAEHLKEFDNGKTIEWRKIMCGDFGGLVPKFCVRRSMPEKLALDAHRFIQWIYQPEETQPESLPPQPQQDNS